jgi:hypothetical protein
MIYSSTSTSAVTSPIIGSYWTRFEQKGTAGSGDLPCERKSPGLARVAWRADQIRCRFFTSDKINNQLSLFRDVVLCPHRPVFCFAGNMKELRAALPSSCREIVVFTPIFPSLRSKRRNIKSLGFQSRITVCTSTIVRPTLPAH